MRFLKAAAAAFLFMLASVGTLQAQSNSEVTGTVADPNGGAVAGASVKLVNQATKIEAETNTNQSGSFAFVNLKPASYVLFVEARGFKRAQTPSFNVGVTEAVTQNVALVVGEVAEVVEVVAGAEMVQRTSTDLGTVTVNSSATAIAAGVGKISNLAQGTTPRQIQFGIKLKLLNSSGTDFSVCDSGRSRLDSRY